MKTRARLALEKRFRQWAHGKTLATLSAAALLGLTLSSAPADAQSVCVGDGGYGGPSIAAVAVAAVSGGPTVSVLINGTKVADLPVDANGIVHLDGTYESGGTRFVIAGADSGFAPIAFVDQGTGVSLLVLTDLFITADAGAPATLTLVANSANALPTGCPGGTHTFSASMDGAVIAPNGTVSVTAEAFISDPAAEGTKRIVVNRVAGDDVTGPSMIEVVAGSQLLAEFFSDLVFENSQCGSLESFNCAFRLQNTIDFRFVNTGDIIYSAGSFKNGALEQAVENLAPGQSGIGQIVGTAGVPFSKFSAAVATQPRFDLFEVGALIRLGTLSNGIDPVNEPFRLRVGSFTADLPAHSFVQRTFFGVKFFVFDGTLADGSRLKVVLTPLFGRQVSLVAVGRGDVMGPSTLVDVAVGNDSGGAAARVFSK